MKQQITKCAFGRRVAMGAMAVFTAVTAYAAQPPVQPLEPAGKANVTYDSLVISRHPNGCTKGKESYQYTGIYINSNGTFGSPSSLCSQPRKNGNESGYDLIFYHQFTADACMYDSQVAFPFFVCNTSTVKIRDTGEVGWNNFLNYTESTEVDDPDFYFDFDSILYVCTDGETAGLLKHGPVYNYIQDHTEGQYPGRKGFVIGNKMQQTKDPLSPDDQRIYLIQKSNTNRKYLFMVKRFKNASGSGPEAQQMTIVVRWLN
jgi:hypothetical protein